MANFEKRKTKDGDYEEVKSFEEIDIANYLYINGINYVYEKEIYDPTIGTKKPDFYLPDYDIYYEHWALDENEQPPKIFEGYLENYHQKKQFYKEKKFKLIGRVTFPHRTPPQEGKAEMTYLIQTVNGEATIKDDDYFKILFSGYDNRIIDYRRVWPLNLEEHNKEFKTSSKSTLAVS